MTDHIPRRRFFGLAFAAASAPSPAEPPRGYSIPLVDLAGTQARQVVVDRKPGANTSATPPPCCSKTAHDHLRLPEGHGKGAIVTEAQHRRRQDVERAAAGAGQLVDVARNADHPPRGRQRGMKRLMLFSGMYPIRMSISEDDRRTWTPLKPIGTTAASWQWASVMRLTTATTWPCSTTTAVSSNPKPARSAGFWSTRLSPPTAG